MMPHQALLARHHYAIVDRFALNPAAWHEALPLRPLVPVQLQSDADKMPALLPLGELSAPQLVLLCDNLLAAEQGEADALLACLLHIPGGDTDALVRHFSNHLLLRSPQGRALLRYYDPRVFVHLTWLLNPDQLADLFGPTTQWTCLLKHQWVSIPRPVAAESCQYWGASRQQRVQLDQVGLINAVLANWLAPASPAWADLSAFVPLARQVEAALSTAQQRYGLQDAADLAEFAVQALRHGASFHLHDLIQRVLARVNTGATTYADACALIEPHQWAAIAGHAQH
ncbi:DUF4123 domain-containing protein [Chitiniphilus purpureus]|uniref:DUF4123 domain-containing protein n=1 Tax=Chitiniphilus purpureus TaxID=2981137 RepID=A0ABY6DPH1_9NEIS|nr:DUF4123 domain-containing protein [Chitiniphilus sp. CD1]UXY16285.1 DUF4123 domain-containing protein [Chitiniphilus sp. CD1]